jgi:hypothetical protein
VTGVGGGGTAGEVVRRRPGAAAQGIRRGSAVLGNKQAWEVHGCLGKRPEQLVDGERERGGERQAAVAMAGGAARGGARRGNDRLL